MGEWGGWSGRRDSNPRQPAWKADTYIFTAWKQRIPLHSALLTTVHYTAENTAVAKGLQDLLPCIYINFSGRSLKPHSTLGAAAYLQMLWGGVRCV
jgi:hypothetical protein